MKKAIILEGQKVWYEFTVKNVKNINVRIKTDKTVCVSANKNMPLKSVEDFMQSKSRLILNALLRFENLEKHSALPLIYDNHEKVILFGITFSIIVNKSKNNLVYTADNSLVINTVNVNDNALKQKLVQNYLLTQLTSATEQLCEEAYNKFEKYSVPVPQIKYKTMKSRWGSCNYERGILTFNTKLMHYPAECLKLVVYHEFTHFVCHDHSKEFYKTLSQFIPNWQELNKELKQGI